MAYLYVAPYAGKPTCTFGWATSDYILSHSLYVKDDIVIVQMPTDVAARAVFDTLFDHYHPLLVNHELPMEYFEAVAGYIRAQAAAFGIIGQVYPRTPGPLTRFDIIDSDIHAPTGEPMAKTEKQCRDENARIEKQIEELRVKLHGLKFHVEAGDRGYYSLGKFYTLAEAERVAETDADSWITPLTPEAKAEMAATGRYRFRS